MSTKADGETKVAVFYFNAGGGHRAAALALKSELDRHIHGDHLRSLLNK
jgi:hypothetical protein